MLDVKEGCRTFAFYIFFLWNRCRHCYVLKEYRNATAKNLYNVSKWYGLWKEFKYLASFELFYKDCSQDFRSVDDVTGKLNLHIDFKYVRFSNKKKSPTPVQLSCRVLFAIIRTCLTHPPSHTTIYCFTKKPKMKKIWHNKIKNMKYNPYLRK